MRSNDTPQRKFISPGMSVEQRCTLKGHVPARMVEHYVRDEPGALNPIQVQEIRRLLEAVGGDETPSNPSLNGAIPLESVQNGSKTAYSVLIRPNLT